MRATGLNWQGLIEQLQQALPYTEVTDQSLAYFKYPKRTVSINLPVRMDDGSVRMFRGYRTVHSTARGPSMGGLRYKAGMSAHECEVLAAIMTLKAAVADLPLGGSYGSKDARGRSAALVTARVLQEAGVPLERARVAVFGYGDVARRAAGLLAEQGALVVALSDHAGPEGESATYASSGLDLAALSEHHAAHGSLSGFATDITPDELAELDVDVLVLAYDYGAVNAGNAHAVRARYVVEATNRAVLPEAERFLTAQGVQVIPDVVASLGGIVVNYLEWVQDASNFFWTETEIEAAIDARVNAALDTVFAFAHESGTDLRTAAYAVALNRLHNATVMRGVYP